MRKKVFYSESRFGQTLISPKKHLCTKILLILVSIILILLISIGIQFAIQYTVIEDVQTWTSSLPSYWGGVIGGVISGTISFIGVFLTIRYYKNSDATKNRIEHMPFINIRMLQAQKIEIPDLIKEKTVEIPNRNYEIDKNKVMLLDLELENIGNGFANMLVIHIGTNLGGEEYHELLKINEKTHLKLKIYLDDMQHCQHNVVFCLQYIDCMTNEYIQQYEVKYSKKSIKIGNGYPKFIGQTHSICN